MTLEDLLKEGIRQLMEVQAPEAKLDAQMLLQEAFGLDMVHFLMNRRKPLEDSQTVQRAIEAYKEMIQKRCKRIPLQYILGTQEFMGLTFEVNCHVLIPRQDTETLVETVLEEQKGKNKKVLDLCTGSGCIAVSLAALGGYKEVTATDLSQEALKVAKRNADHLLGENYLCLRQGDLFHALLPGETYDILTCNPPYIPTEIIKELQPEVRNYEPFMALDGHGDGLEFYRQIADQVRDWLNPSGSIYLEIGYDQANAVSSLLEKAGFDNIKIIKDAPGLDRVVCGESIIRKR